MEVGQKKIFEGRESDHPDSNDRQTSIRALRPISGGTFLTDFHERTRRTCVGCSARNLIQNPTRVRRSRDAVF
jgi:hypothetical protein